MANTIEARIRQKVDTLEEWNNNALILLGGEQAVVLNGNGEPVNIKYGDGTKRFSDLPFWIKYDQGAYTKVSTTVLPVSDGAIHYSIVGSGTYTQTSGGSVVVPVGSLGIISNNGTTWSLDQTVELPQSEVLNGLNNSSVTEAGSANNDRLLNLKISEIYSELNPDSESFYRGVIPLIIGTGNVNTNRTRVDNKYQIIDEDSYLREINVKVTKTGDVVFMFVKKTSTTGLYTINTRIPYTLNTLGDVTIDYNVFGSDILIDKDSFFAVKLITGAIDIINGVDGDSFQLLGNVDIDSTPVTTSSGIIDFNIKLSKVYNYLDKIQENTDSINNINEELTLQIDEVLGFDVTDSISVSSSTNRTRIDGNYEATFSGVLTSLKIACNIGGSGSVKLVRRNANGSYTIKKSVPFSFIEGVNVISAELWDNQVIEVGDTFAFYSATASFSILNDNTKLTYYCPSELLESTLPSVIQTSTGVIKFNYTVSVQGGSRLDYIQDEIDNIDYNKQGYLNYNSLNKTFTFYNRQGDTNKYFSYQIQLVENLTDLVYLYEYRLNGGGYFSKSKNNIFTKICDTIFTSENEMAIQFQGKADYTGGFHGDERIDVISGCYIKFFADGMELIDLSKDLFIECDSFTYMQLSSLHETANTAGTFIPGHPQIAWHLKYSIFENNKISLKNVIEFISPQNVTGAHAGLFCVAKPASNNAILPSYKLQSLTSSDAHILATDNYEKLITMWSNINNISVNVSGEFKEGYNNTTDINNFEIWDRANDSKYYRRCNSLKSFASGSRVINEQVVIYR